MPLFAELNGNRITQGTIVIPYAGIYHADVKLDTEQSLSGKVSLTLGGLTLAMSVYRTGVYTGITSLRLAGGAGGWGKQLPPQEYRSQLGVKLSLVAGDAARLAGERVSITQDMTLGQWYERQAGRASKVLDQFAPVWWMRSDGVTVVGDRDSTNISSPFDVMADGTDLSLGKVTIATDKPEDWQPGRTFSSPLISARKISAVIHRLDRERLRTEVWS